MSVTTEPARPASGWRARIAGATLELEALAMTASTGVTAVLGLGYWTIAAHGFSMAEVGRASAIISAATVLATLANLSLGGMYERFLPVSGVRTRRYLIGGALISGLLALLLGAGFVLVGPTERILLEPWESFAFPVLVISLAQFALLDQALIGLRRARWAALKNVVHAVVKLGLAAAAFAVTASGFSLVAAWVVPALLLVVGYLPVVWRRWSVGGVHDLPVSLPPRAELWSFFGTSFGIMVIGSIAPLVIPLLVVQHLGAESNAAFTMAWTLYSAVALLLGTVVGPYIAQASTPGAPVRQLTLRFIGILASLTVLGALFLWVLAPVLLGLLGERYASETESLVQLMALSLLPTFFGMLYAGLSRVVRRLRLAMVLQVASATLVVGGVAVVIPRYGLAGIGYTYLAVEIVLAAILVVPVWRTFRRLAG